MNGISEQPGSATYPPLWLSSFSLVALLLFVLEVLARAISNGPLSDALKWADRTGYVLLLALGAFALVKSFRNLKSRSAVIIAAPFLVSLGLSIFALLLAIRGTSGSLSARLLFSLDTVLGLALVTATALFSASSNVAIRWRATALLSIGLSALVTLGLIGALLGVWSQTEIDVRSLVALRSPFVLLAVPALTLALLSVGRVDVPDRLAWSAIGLSIASNILSFVRSSWLASALVLLSLWGVWLAKRSREEDRAENSVATMLVLRCAAVATMSVFIAGLFAVLLMQNPPDIGARIQTANASQVGALAEAQQRQLDFPEASSVIAVGTGEWRLNRIRKIVLDSDPLSGVRSDSWLDTPGPHNQAALVYAQVGLLPTIALIVGLGLVWLRSVRTRDFLASIGALPLLTFTLFWDWTLFTWAVVALWLLRVLNGRNSESANSR